MHVPEMMRFSGIFLRTRTFLVTNRRFLHCAAARNGLGIACLTRYLGDNDPGLVSIDPPPSARPPSARNVWLGLHKNMRNA